MACRITRFPHLPLRQIVPNKDVIWLNQTDNDFDDLVPVVSDEENSIFELLSIWIKIVK